MRRSRSQIAPTKRGQIVRYSLGHRQREYRDEAAASERPIDVMLFAASLWIARAARSIPLSTALCSVSLCTARSTMSLPLCPSAWRRVYKEVRRPRHRPGQCSHPLTT